MNISKELSKSEILCFYFLFVVGVSISKFALSASPWAVAERACFRGNRVIVKDRLKVLGRKRSNCNDI